MHIFQQLIMRYLFVNVAKRCLYNSRRYQIIIMYKICSQNKCECCILKLLKYFNMATPLSIHPSDYFTSYSCFITKTFIFESFRRTHTHKKLCNSHEDPNDDHLQQICKQILIQKRSLVNCLLRCIPVSFSDIVCTQFMSKFKLHIILHYLWGRV